MTDATVNPLEDTNTATSVRLRGPFDKPRPIISPVTAAADAYTHAAIDEAYRAVRELPG